MMDFAIYYSAEAYSTKHKTLMGRQAAGAGFLRAVANAKPARLWCFAAGPGHAKQCADSLAAFGSPQTQVRWINFLNSSRIAEAGLMYRPDPLIVYEAWRRLSSATPRSYSLCGVTHTTATHPIMDGIAGMPTAPLEDWDAIICTSRTVRDSVKLILESQAEYLRERLGTTRLTLPQLPLIPLGVHSSDFVVEPGQRESARAELGIGEDETVVLFLGRLSHLDKAHPLPMYLALEACARETKMTLIEAGWFPSEKMEKAFKEDAMTLSPSVRHLYLDAREPKQTQQAWAAADIFTSFSDNIQETFGLTPVEAMAAGLPVVVSDWNGYKDTVRNGIDGFRVPTMTMPPGTGQALGDLYDMGAYRYHQYCGSVSQLVAVDVAGATEAFRRLIFNPDLRRRMGEAGRLRVRSEFDWSIVFRRYLALWHELGERRRAAPALYPPLKQRVRPERGDPFTIFATYPSAPLGDATQLRRATGAEAATAIAWRDLQTTRFAHPVTPPPELIKQILEKLPQGAWTTFGGFILNWPENFRRPLFSAVIWLAKIGMIEFRLPQRVSARRPDAPAQARSPAS